MSDRKQDCMWLYFDKTKVAGKAICWATCKKCGKEMHTYQQNLKRKSDLNFKNLIKNLIKPKQERKSQNEVSHMHLGVWGEIFGLCALLG